MKVKFVITVFLALVIGSCGDSYTPKPRGYFRIDLPQKGYRSFSGDLPFSFMYPDYAQVRHYEGLFKGEQDAENWINIDFPDFSAHIHLTYKAIRNDLGNLVEDAHTFAYKHVVKADAINQLRFSNENNHVYGVLYQIKGNAASALQFFCTDSVAHFLRGALYFDCEPNKDSLAPVVEFLEEDVNQLMESLEWAHVTK